MNGNRLIFIEATKLLTLSSESQLETVEVSHTKTLHMVNKKTNAMQFFIPCTLDKTNKWFVMKNSKLALSYCTFILKCPYYAIFKIPNFDLRVS